MTIEKLAFRALSQVQENFVSWRVIWRFLQTFDNADLDLARGFGVQIRFKPQASSVNQDHGVRGSQLFGTTQHVARVVAVPTANGLLPRPHRQPGA